MERPVEIEALLRREAIYGSYLAAWRKQLALRDPFVHDLTSLASVALDDDEADVVAVDLLRLPVVTLRALEHGGDLAGVFLVLDALMSAELQGRARPPAGGRRLQRLL